MTVVVPGRCRNPMGASSSCCSGGHHVCNRITLRCGGGFSKRGIDTLFLNATREACGNGGRLPCGCLNLMTHTACGCGCQCVTRVGTNCGNSRGFTGKGRFNFFPSFSINCTFARSICFPGGSVLDFNGVHTSCKLINGSHVNKRHFLFLPSTCVQMSDPNCCFKANRAGCDKCGRSGLNGPCMA